MRAAGLILDDQAQSLTARPNTSPEAEWREAARCFREMLEVVKLRAAKDKSVHDALVWFRFEPVPDLDGATPAELVRQGRHDAVKQWLKDVPSG